ncbi:MAG TPA: bis(5'-nucleosyl)-tetraphosphatase (symmetrical) YqeK [Oculatellaceae cyanobacterium]
MAKTKHQLASGVPAELTLDFAKEWLRPRISERRFRHTEGVVETAHEMAKRCGADEFLAQLGGWLHDACKEIKDKELIKMAKDYGLKLHPVEEINGHLLHGPVAAELVKHELKLTNKEVLDAIAEHTLGAVEMTVLSKILFLADALEPGRSPEYCKPIWQALHPCVWLDDEELVNAKAAAAESTAESAVESEAEPDSESHSYPGHIAGRETVYGLAALKLTSQTPLDLDQAILVACDIGLTDLIECKRVIHPKTVKVRNVFLQILKDRQATAH